MTDEEYNQAAAIKAELAVIDSLLTAPGGVRPPYQYEVNFPNDNAAIVALAQPGLDAANAAWEGVLNDRKTALQAQFSTIGEA